MNAAYKGKDMERSGEIWRFQKSVDFAKLGEALGCAAFRVDKPGQLKELLPKAFATNRPVVIDVVTEENALAEAWAPGGAGGHDLIAPGFERVVDRDPPLDSIAQGLTFGEGPVWDKRSGQLVPGRHHRQHHRKWKPGVGREVVLRPSGHANGMTFDKEGRLTVAGWCSRTIYRFEHDGTITTIASKYQDKKFNSPNDIVVRSDGSTDLTDSAGVGS